MIKIFCDKCGMNMREIVTKEYVTLDGHVVRITPGSNQTLCKPCLVQIVREGQAFHEQATLKKLEKLFG